MSIAFEIKELVLSSIRELSSSEDIDLSKVVVERPKNQDHGELSTNAAIAIARFFKKNPVEIAKNLSLKLQSDRRISSVEIAGRGFINFKLHPEIWMNEMLNSLKKGYDYGRPRIGRNRKVNLEFISANPTGPLHMGHVRGAVFGDVLGNLLEYSGFKVDREYYVNDGGAQVDSLARSVFLRYLQSHGHDVSFDGAAYKGDYLIPVGEKLKNEFGDLWTREPESVWIEPIKAFAILEMMNLICEDLSSLGIRMDRFVSEKSLYEKIDSAIENLKQKNLIYEGTLPSPPKSKRPENWKPGVQTLFRSTEFGDDVDRPIRKADGTLAYFASDIAYHYDKILRGYDELINVFGADHGGYCKRLKAAVSALSDQEIPFDIKLMQTVRMSSSDGYEKMSKREGAFLKMKDVADKVGSDVLRGFMLTRRNDAPLDFNVENLLKISEDNPVFYIGYAYARISSVLRKLSETGVGTDDSEFMKANFRILTHDRQISLARKIAEWPDAVQVAAMKREPHRIVYYLLELSSDFHSLWASLKFFQDGDEEGNMARIGLARSAGAVIHAGLLLLGVAPPEKM